jgi:glycosyltransferase involved in cell wall biosynthesis/SAM-dependent methyltransferase
VSARVCPACGSPLPAVSVVRGPDRLHGVPGEFEIAVCATCGSGRTMPFVPADRLGELYPSDYNAYALPTQPLLRAAATGLFRARYSLALRSPPLARMTQRPAGRLLDVGSGRGDLGVVLGGRGWGVVGVEPSAEACVEASGRGVHSIEGTLQTVGGELEPGFDAVVFNHSLEHVVEPVEDLRIALRLLARGGIVIVSVPNFGGWQARRFGAEWFHLDLPRHRSHFTARGLLLLLARSGFADVEMTTSTSADGLPVSLEYRLFGRRRFDRGVARYALMATTLLMAPVAKGLNRTAGEGDILGADRSLLLVAQLTPPSTLVAARRAAGLTKYLSRLGYRVTVLTSTVSGEGSIEGAAEVIRTGDLLSSRLNWRRGHFQALSGNAAAGYARPSRLEAVAVPDLAVLTWMPAALLRAFRLRGRRFDCVITSSPPPSTHVVGWALQKRGSCWIAELRDGWTFEPPRPAWPFGLQRCADRALERSLLKHADAVVAVTDPIVEDARRRLGVDAHLITNGFDPESVPKQPDADTFTAGKHSLLHTGRIALARSSPRPLLEALRRLRTSAPATSEQLEVVFAGPLSAEEHDELGAPDLRGSVRVLGPVPHDRALGLQRGADSLLVITEGAQRRSVATGKLFEYLAAARPILVLGAGTEAARIVEEAGAGFAAPADEPDAIADALRRLVEETPAAAAPEAVERYSYPALARVYDDLIAQTWRR